MPQLNAVKTLKTLALECVSQYVLDVSFKMKNDLIGSHKYFTEKLPGSIRTDILACTSKILEGGELRRHGDFEKDSYSNSSLYWKSSTKMSRLHYSSQWNGVINAMLDQKVYCLPYLYFYKESEIEFVELVSIINRYDTNLQNLSMEFIDFTLGRLPYFNMVNAIQYSLENNLASKLSRLILPQGICDTAMLKIIGTKSMCLKHLGLTNAPCVEKTGIRYLLFKDGRFEENIYLTDTEFCRMLNLFYNNKELLNPCCWTIEELIVTKSSECYASILMILSCVKTLKSLVWSMENGWPKKSVGDAIVTIWKNSPKPRIFELTVLCDRNLTIDKLVVFGKCLPYVSNVTTDISSLVVSEQTSLFWGRVKTLKILPRSRSSLDNFPFHEFMSLYGHNLVHLAFDKNDMFDIDVADLLKSCPNLETVQAKLQIYKSPVGQFSKLHTLLLIKPNVKTINWVFENCPCLEEVKIYADDNELSAMNHIIMDPPLFVRNSLKRLQMEFYGLTLLTPETIIQFISKCSNLKELGPLPSWFLRDNFCEKVQRFVRENNYDLHVYEY